MSVRWSTISPFKPVLTEHNLPDQSGRVILVTGGSGGIGKELVEILYGKNAQVYVAARSETKTKPILEEIRKIHPKSTGKMIFIELMLDDLTTIKKSAQDFLAVESQLNVLFLNAGVMVPPQGSKSSQGYELQLGINNLAHQLFLHFLTPTLIETAKLAPRNSTRVIWVSSSAADGAPKPAIDFDNMDYRKEEGIWSKYSRSKAGNVLQAVEFAHRTKGSRILSMSLNPGNFVTNLQQNMPRLQLMAFKLISHPVRNGAYTELFAGFDATITEENNGGWVSPFGKLQPPRKDLTDPELCEKYWKWCDEQVKQYY